LTRVLIQILKLWFWGHVKIGKLKKPGWTGYADLYLRTCKEHGLVLTRVTGGRTLWCPICRGFMDINDVHNYVMDIKYDHILTE
jgi:hypothetical protein